MRNMVAVVVLLMSGCGDSNSGAPNDSSSGPNPDSGGGNGVDQAWYRSGTRIKMKLLSSPDGAKQFHGWRDTMRNEDCNFYTTADSMMRCLPTEAAYLVEQSTIYADAACTVRVASATSCATPPKYAIGLTLDSCGTFYKYGPVYMRGAVVSAPYQKSGVSCTPHTPGATTTYYALGAMVPLTDFQSATIAVE